MSNASRITVPPSSTARATVASVSSTAKETFQNAGASSGTPGGIGETPPTPAPSSISTV